MKKFIFISLFFTSVFSQFNYLSSDGWRFKNDNSPNYIMMAYYDGILKKELETYYTFENDYLCLQYVYFRGEETFSEVEEYNIFYEDIVTTIGDELYPIIDASRDNDSDTKVIPTNEIPYKCTFYTKDKTIPLWARSIKGTILNKYYNSAEFMFYSKNDADDFIKKVITKCDDILLDIEFVTDRSFLQNFTEQFIIGGSFNETINQKVEIINNNFGINYLIEGDKVYLGDKQQLVLQNIDNFFGHKSLSSSYLRGITFNTCNYCTIFRLDYDSYECESFTLYSKYNEVYAEIIQKGKYYLLYEGSYSGKTINKFYPNPEGNVLYHIDTSLSNDYWIIYKGRPSDNGDQIFKTSNKDLHPAIVLYILSLLKMAGQ